MSQFERSPKPATWFPRLGRRSHEIGREFFGSCVDLLYPPQCANCEADLPCQPGKTLLCHQCCRQLLASRGPSCRRCGHRGTTATSDGQQACFHCRSQRLTFDSVTTLGPYQGELRSALLRMKRPRNEALAHALSELWWQHEAERLAAIDPDVVIGVPMHWRRRLARGTDPADLLADRIACWLGVPYGRRLARRRRNTLPQGSLPRSSRMKNVRGAFRLNKSYDWSDARVLLIDDILTTGATCQELAREMKREGARSVAVGVVARTEVAGD